MKRIGMDIGGTKISLILTTENPLEIINKKVVESPKLETYDNIVKKIIDLIAEFKSLSGEKTTIGIGMPGSISPITHQVRNSSLLALNGQTFQIDLEKHLKEKVTIANDANCMTLSEALYGVAKNHKVVVGIIMGTGLGGGLVIDKKLHLGHQGYAAEWGHTSIDFNGIKCWCGQQGCIENYISGTAFEKLYFAMMGIHKKGIEINQDWLNDCNKAKKVVDQFVVYFARALANLIYTIDPDIFVIGGGLSNASFLYDVGVKRLKKHFLEKTRTFNIVKSQLGSDSGVYGAAILPTIES